MVTLCIQGQSKCIVPNYTLLPKRLILRAGLRLHDYLDLAPVLLLVRGSLEGMLLVHHSAVVRGYLQCLVDLLLVRALLLELLGSELVALGSVLLFG